MQSSWHWKRDPPSNLGAVIRGPHRSWPPGAGAGIIAVLLIVAVLLFAGALAGPAAGAELVGGARQAAIERAYLGQPAQRHLQVVSVRASTVSPTWAVLTSAAPEGGDRAGSGFRTITLLRTYFHLVHGSERAGPPPATVRADLGVDFKVAVLYTGTGAETIHYEQAYRSVCSGAGGFVDEQNVTVTPMSWSVR